MYKKEGDLAEIQKRFFKKKSFKKKQKKCACLHRFQFISRTCVFPCMQFCLCICFLCLFHLLAASLFPSCLWGQVVFYLSIRSLFLAACGARFFSPFFQVLLITFLSPFFQVLILQHGHQNYHDHIHKDIHYYRGPILVSQWRTNQSHKLQ